MSPDDQARVISDAAEKEFEEGSRLADLFHVSTLADIKTAVDRDSSFREAIATMSNLWIA